MQVMAIPFALQHEAVGVVFGPTGNETVAGWIGYLEGPSWGVFIDGYLLMMFGGIPWQVLVPAHCHSSAVAS